MGTFVKDAAGGTRSWRISHETLFVKLQQEAYYKSGGSPVLCSSPLSIAKAFTVFKKYYCLATGARTQGLFRLFVQRSINQTVNLAIAQTISEAR